MYSWRELSTEHGTRIEMQAVLADCRRRIEAVAEDYPCIYLISATSNLHDAEGALSE